MPGPAGGMLGKGLSWVGHKVGDWLGLTGEPRTLPVPQNSMTTMNTNGRITSLALPNPLSTFNATPTLGPAI